MKRNPLVDALSTALDPYGYRRKGRTWYLDSDDALRIVDLQKSQYGDAHYINLAVWLKSFGDNPAPKEHQCHIRTRLSALPGIGSDVDQALNLDDPSLTFEERQEVLQDALRVHGLPFLEAAGTLEGLRQLDSAGTLDRLFTKREVREMLQANGGSAAS